MILRGGVCIAAKGEHGTTWRARDEYVGAPPGPMHEGTVQRVLTVVDGNAVEYSSTCRWCGCVFAVEEVS